MRGVLARGVIAWLLLVLGPFAVAVLRERVHLGVWETVLGMALVVLLALGLISTCDDVGAR